MESSHCQLSSRLTDRLSGDNTNGFADIDDITGGKVSTIAALADPDLGSQVSGERMMMRLRIFSSGNLNRDTIEHIIMIGRSGLTIMRLVFGSMICSAQIIFKLNFIDRNRNSQRFSISAAISSVQYRPAVSLFFLPSCSMSRISPLDRVRDGFSQNAAGDAVTYRTTISSIHDVVRVLFWRIGDTSTPSSVPQSGIVITTS